MRRQSKCNTNNTITDGFRPCSLNIHNQIISYKAYFSASTANYISTYSSSRIINHSIEYMSRNHGKSPGEEANNEFTFQTAKMSQNCLLLPMTAESGKPWNKKK